VGRLAGEDKGMTPEEERDIRRAELTADAIMSRVFQIVLLIVAVWLLDKYWYAIFVVIAVPVGYVIENKKEIVDLGSGIFIIILVFVALTRGGKRFERKNRTRLESPETIRRREEEREDAIKRQEHQERMRDVKQRYDEARKWEEEQFKH
jgi:hypothetical protein